MYDPFNVSALFYRGVVVSLVLICFASRSSIVAAKGRNSPCESTTW
jgi:hypothetical protein